MAPSDLPWDVLLCAARDPMDGHPRELPGLCRADHGWEVSLEADDARRPWLELYLPVCNGGRDRPFVLGHLGQSLDGFIATPTGDSSFVTGQENIRHLHRLRALCDAVIVGAGTVHHDDPQLTTRLVEGPNPARIVLDPRRRLRDDHRLFTDGAARSLRVVASGCGAPRDDEIPIPASGGRLDLAALVRALQELGYRRLFVEGGGETVSSFLEAGLLDRLHIAIAPLLIGTGRPAIRLAAHARLGDCLRPPARVFRMGQDVLYDLDLRCGPAPAPLAGPALARIC